MDLDTEMKLPAHSTLITSKNLPTMWFECQVHIWSTICMQSIIGREHDKKEVIKLLSAVNENENVFTVAVVGLGGLGKTTLAQLAFNDQDFSTDFELKIWVYVSEIYDVKTILQKICSSGNSDMEKLQQEVRKKIDGKKYLLVLDDLWNEDHEDWLKLKTLLVGGAGGSRILVTTRSAKVAASTRSFRSYELKGLNEDESWSLFNKMVIGQRNEPEVSKFEYIGREIVKNCVGVPLTIRSIGRVLYNETKESEWLRVKNGFANVNESIREDLKILKLSYDHLPSHLKQCFAYCSLFPKGYGFKKEALIQLWVAQGFVQSSGDYQHLEDAGEKYFSELLWRSFFQEARIVDDFEDIWGFKMHDLMCDLARFVAGTECSISDQVVDEKTRHVSLAPPSGSSSIFPNGLLQAKKMRTLLVWRFFFQEARIVDDFEDILGFKMHDLMSDLARFEAGTDCSVSDQVVDEKTRYVSLDQSDSSWVFPNGMLEAKKIRTLLVWSQSYYFGSPKNSDLDTIFSTFRCLRALDLSFSEFKSLPDSIGKLKHLRYLDISENYRIEKLPRCIEKLQNLQTLKLSGCRHLLEMPNEITKIASLRYLDISGNERIEKLPRCIEKLQNLQTLILSNCRNLLELPIEITKIASLRYVDISGNERIEKLPRCIEKLQNLQTLKLSCCQNLLELPSEIMKIASLRRIEIHGCESLKHMPDGLQQLIV